MINRIYNINDSNGVNKDTTEGIETAFLNLYSNQLGSKVINRNHVDSSVVKKGPIVDEEDRLWLCKNFDKNDVKEAMWQIGGDKAPGPDGYSSQFFKDTWDIVRDDICDAVLDFFNKGKMLKQLNTTTITLIPKVKNPTNMT